MLCAAKRATRASTPPEGYAGFDAKVTALRASLLEFLEAARNGGKTVAAYGAAAKGNTLLNYCGVGTAEIAYCVDRNPAKQNTLLPGSHIPVHPVEYLYEAPPDFLLVLPWNIRSEIVRQLNDLRRNGTRFIIAVPETNIIA